MQTLKASIGIEFEHETEADAEATTARSFSMSVKTSETFGTSDYDGYVGDAADMFLVPGINIIFSISDEISFSKCQVSATETTSYDLKNDPDAMVWLTALDVKHEIEKLDRLIETGDGTNDKELNDAKDGWQRLLDRNKELKANAVPMTNAAGQTFPEGKSIDDSFENWNTGRYQILCRHYGFTLCH